MFIWELRRYLFALHVFCQKNGYHPFARCKRPFSCAWKSLRPGVLLDTRYPACKFSNKGILSPHISLQSLQSLQSYLHQGCFVDWNPEGFIRNPIFTCQESSPKRTASTLGIGMLLPSRCADVGSRLDVMTVARRFKMNYAMASETCRFHSIENHKGCDNENQTLPMTHWITGTLVFSSVLLIYHVCHVYYYTYPILCNLMC